MINYESFQSVEFQTSPFQYARVIGLLDSTEIDTLIDHLPELGYSESVGREGHYHLWDRTLIDNSMPTSGIDLHPAWNALIAELLSQRYRQTISGLMAVSLEDTQLKVRLCKYPPGCWMLPHTDRPDRVVSEIIYLNRGWLSAWGGALEILNANLEPVREILPLFNTSVMFARSDTSFHAVAPVKDEAAVPRLSLLIQFIRVPTAASGS